MRFCRINIHFYNTVIIIILCVYVVLVFHPHYSVSIPFSTRIFVPKVVYLKTSYSILDTIASRYCRHSQRPTRILETQKSIIFCCFSRQLYRTPLDRLLAYFSCLPGCSSTLPDSISILITYILDSSGSSSPAFLPLVKLSYKYNKHTKHTLL